MAWWNFKKDNVDESIKSFQGKGEVPLTPKQIENITGEGLESLGVEGYGNTSLSSFNLFYNQYINKRYDGEVQKILAYRQMAQMSEIADVLEDATNESVRMDEDGECLFLKIKDKDLLENENICKNLNDEFKKLFYDKLCIQDMIWDLFWNYFIDGRVYYERIINKARPSEGIIGLKKLPSESMDFFINPQTGKPTSFLQYLKGTRPVFNTLEEAEKNKDVVVFEPQQISFINYGVYGKTKYDIYGYLEKAKIPYNQLKLLETSVIIYRIVRAPERLVFRIDTGNMPLQKAMAFVEKVKQKMVKKQTYDPQTGRLNQEPELLSILENFYLPQCISLNTKISLVDGRDLTLKEIIDEYNKGIKLSVYSVEQKTGKIIEGNIEWAGITRKNADLLRVHLDNNEFIDCTPDHKFVLRDGTECRADKLVEGQSLMPLSNNHKFIKVEVLNIREDTGCLTIKDPGDNHNFGVSSGVFIKNSADGRGSQIESVGGNSAGFTELDDLHYFAKKLFRALKYPMSRVINDQEKRNADTIFGGNNVGEITRDEIKWAMFLERQQDKFCRDFTKIFLLHLDFKGLKKQYDLNSKKLDITMFSPSNYKDQMEQNFLETRFNNYNTVADREEISKYYSMKTYLGWTDEDIMENVAGFAKDRELGLVKDENI